MTEQITYGTSAFDPRQDWLEKRRNGIGGSDAAAVIGISPWKSPLALWAEKTGQVDEPNLEELEYIEWGQVLEDPIAQKYQQVTGRYLEDPGRFAIVQHPEKSFMHCTIDRKIHDAHEAIESLPYYADGAGDLSIKNVGFFKATEWEEEAPLTYQVQMMHELAVTGLQWGSFAVLIGGQKFGWLDTPRNEKFISYLVEIEEEFWNLVIRGIPPEPDASDSTKEVLLRLYPQDTGESKALPEAFTAIRDRRQNLKDQIKAAEADIQLLENQIKAAIGEATFGLLPDGSGFSWKKQHRKEYFVKASDYRTLRVIKAGKGKK